MTTPPDRGARGTGSGLAPALATALAYALVAWAALQLAVAPGYASPVFPSAGIALAATLVYGRAGLCGAIAGSAAVNLWLAILRDQVGAVDLLMPLAISLGVGLQAGFGAWLVRRFVSQPLILAEPRDLARFFLLGAPLSCLISASVGIASLVAAGRVPAALAGSNWWNWWIGDTLGVLIAAPLVLSFIARPRAEWRHRRLLVGLPLVLATLFLAAAMLWGSDVHQQRQRAAFERDAWHLADKVDLTLAEPLHSLQAVYSVMASHENPSAALLQRAARPWLQQPLFIQAIGWSQRVARTGVPEFEAEMRAEGLGDYRVFDRVEPPATTTDADVLAIRAIAPLQGNQAALGVNALSVAAARQAILEAVARGTAVASAGFRLTQASGDQTGIVLYRAIYRGPAATPDERAAAWQGVVFVTLQLDAMVGHLLAQQPGHLQWCLVDLAANAARKRLAGPPGCEAAPGLDHQYERRLHLAGRDLALRVGANAAQLPGASDDMAWLMSVIGLGAVSVLGALLLVVSGRQRRIEAAVRDRTHDLERSALALRDSETRLRDILNHLPVGAFKADAQGRLSDANPRLLQMLGKSLDELRAHELVELFPAADRDECQAMLAALAAGDPVRAPRPMRLRAAGDDGPWVQVQLARLVHQDGPAHGIIGVVEDITEHLRLEAAESARELAETSSRAKSEFVGRMSHELRTPLNAILGFAQLMDKDPSQVLTVRQREWMGQIQKAGWHLLAMINDTLDLSMIESGAIRLEPAALSLTELLPSAVDLVKGPASRRRIRIAAPAIDADASTAFGDPTRVTQILTNLLSNAIKYNVEGGQVLIRAEACGADHVAIRVHDTGPGLTPAQLEHLFEPFNRLGQSSSGIEGTGIGLVISRRLAERMGGTLEGHSQPGQGTTFELVLPCARLAPPPAPAADTGAAPLASYRRRRVHYVEDNATNVELMRGMLAQRPQIDLSVSLLGREALATIPRDRPDVVLLDMHLPDIDGLELLRRLRADPRTARIPVLVVSADATGERIARAEAEGIAGYLCKPLELKTLLAKLDELLGEVETTY